MRDLIYEQALAKQGLPVNYVEKIPLKDIDPNKGLRNQARLEEPLNTDLVDDYERALEAGDEFPALVLVRSSARSKWGLIDGNHRLAARLRCQLKFKGKEKEKMSSVDAYVVECADQFVVDRVTWTFNDSVNGVRNSNNSRHQHGLTLVRKYGMSIKDAAQQVHVKYGTLANILKIEQVRDIAAKQGIDTRKVSDDRLRSVAPLIDLGEDVVGSALNIINSNGLNQEQCAEMIVKVKEARTHNAKLEALEDYKHKPEVAARRAETQGGKTNPKPLPRDIYERLIKDLQRLGENFPDDVALRPIPLKLKKGREAATDVVNRIIRVFGLGALLDRPKT